MADARFSQSEFALQITPDRLIWSPRLVRFSAHREISATDSHLYDFFLGIGFTLA
jgi:hypothetical protein